MPSPRSIRTAWPASTASAPAAAATAEGETASAGRRTGSRAKPRLVSGFGARRRGGTFGGGARGGEGLAMPETGEALGLAEYGEHFVEPRTHRAAGERHPCGLGDVLDG